MPDRRKPDENMDACKSRAIKKAKYRILCISSSKEKSADKNKSKKNMEVLEYLEQNKEISEKSEFDKIKNMKYGELLLAYFSSREFEKSLEDLYDKNKMENI